MQVILIRIPMHHLPTAFTARIALGLAIATLAGQAAARAVDGDPPATDAAAAADDDRPEPRASSATRLDEVSVTASRSAQRIDEVPTAVSILESRDLESQLGVSTGILRALDATVPGLNVSAGGRSQCLTNIRGRTPSFQINGVPANQDLRPSNCNSAFQLSPFAIERVEVVRGATALFGAGAPGGIVNLITRRATSAEPERDLVLQTGFAPERASGTFRNDAYFGVGQDVGTLDYYLGAGWQDYGGDRDPNGERIPATEFDSLALNGSAGWDGGDGVRLRLTGTWYDEDPGREFNLDGAEVDAGVDFPSVIEVQPNPFRGQGRDRQGTLALSLEADDVLSHRLFASAYYQRQEFRQRANFQDANAGAPDFFSDDRENSTAGVRLTLAREFDLGGHELGLEYGLDQQRNRLIRLLLDPTNPATVTGFIAPEVILDTTGLFAQADLSFGALRLTTGARQEWYRGEIGDERADEGLSGAGTPGDFADADLLLANAGAVYDLDEDGAFQIYASWNQGAELTQLGRAARRANDPGLISPEPARSDQYEIGGRGRLGRMETSLAAFYSDSDAASLVQPDPSCAGESFCPLIPLRVPQRVWGVEGTLLWPVSDSLDLGAVFTWQEGEIFNQDLGGFVPFGSDTVSPTRLTLHADWRASDTLSARLQGTYIADTSFFSPSEQAFGFIDTDAVFVADLYATWDTPVGTLLAGVANLFDASYENVTLAAGGFVPTLAEGRRLTVGWRTRF
jgi:iron complex outermembrane receptor protein